MHIILIIRDNVRKKYPCRENDHSGLYTITSVKRIDYTSIFFAKYLDEEFASGRRAVAMQQCSRTYSGMFHGFRRTLYHSIGTQTENNRPSYFDRPLGIFGFYKSQSSSDTKRYRKGCRKIEPENVGRSQRNGGRRNGVGKRDRTERTVGGRRGGRRRKRGRERKRGKRCIACEFPPRGFCAQCDA